MKRSTAILALLFVWPLAGCSHAPTFNILGSFFPSWLVCLVTGIVLAVVVNWLLARFKLENLIAWPVLTYPCMAAFFSFLLWVVYFR
jgi:ABC-type uncharacterized transport system permease subunit